MKKQGPSTSTILWGCAVWGAGLLGYTYGHLSGTDTGHQAGYADALHQEAESYRAGCVGIRHALEDDQWCYLGCDPVVTADGRISWECIEEEAD